MATNVRMVISFPSSQPASEQPSKAKQSKPAGPHDGTTQPGLASADRLDLLHYRSLSLAAERELSSPCPTWLYSSLVVALVQRWGQDDSYTGRRCRGTWLGSALADCRCYEYSWAWHTKLNLDGDHHDGY